MPNKKIYTNTLAQVASKILTAAISIVMIKIISNYLDVAGYGVYAMLYNYLSIFSVLADLGLYTISVREMSQLQNNPEKMERLAGTILSLRSISGVIIIFLSLFVALFLDGYHSHEVLLGIFIVGLFTFFGLVNSSIMSYLQAILKTEFSIIANTAWKLLTFFLILGASYFSLENGLILVLLAGLCGNILMTILTFWYARRFQKIAFAWESEYIRKILRLSIPYGIALFLGVIFFKVDTLLLSQMIPVTSAALVVGIYSLPMKIVDVGMMYGTIFLNSLLPVLTTAVEEKNHEKSRELITKWFELLFGFGVGIAVFGSLFADRIIPFIASREFLETTYLGISSVHVLQIVIWVFLFYFISSLGNYVLIAKNEQKKIIYINLFIALFNIIGNIIFIPKYHLIGGSTVTLVSQILLVIITFFLIRRELEIRKIIFYVFFLFFSGVLSGYCVFLANNYLSHIGNFLALFILSMMFGILYLSFWFFTKKFAKIMLS